MSTKTKKKPSKGKQIIPSVFEEGTFGYFMTAKSMNTKTGNVPTLWIGQTTEKVACSCKESGCPLLPTHKGGEFDDTDHENACYAWNGRVQIAYKAILKGVQKNPDKYSVYGSLELSDFSSKYIRMTGLGDPIVLTDEQWDHILSEIDRHNIDYRSPSRFLKPLGYTHGWDQDRGQKFKSHLMASCHSLEDADKAFDMGWRPAVTLNSEGQDFGRAIKTSKGRILLVCPHLIKDESKKKVAPCNDCGWCSVLESKFQQFGIVFPSHT